MVDIWQPASDSGSITKDTLVRFAGLSASPEATESHISSLEDADKNQVSGWLKLPESQWVEAFEGLNADELKALSAFFTVGEMKVASWQCGSKNPAIIALRLLKAQGAYPEKEFIRWLKKQTDNRYIPYGNALG